MVHHPQRVFLDGTGHGIEHVIAFHLIHNLRILLPVCGKADALTQLVHIVNMVHPVTVHGTKQEYTLDLTHIHAGIRKLRKAGLDRKSCNFDQAMVRSNSVDSAFSKDVMFLAAVRTYVVAHVLDHSEHRNVHHLGHAHCLLNDQ